jgi:hypothetical protein
LRNRAEDLVAAGLTEADVADLARYIVEAGISLDYDEYADEEE